VASWGGGRGGSSRRGRTSGSPVTGPSLRPARSGSPATGRPRSPETCGSRAGGVRASPATAVAGTGLTTMGADRLTSYLQDHLAGSAAAIEVLEALRDEHAGEA